MNSYTLHPVSGAADGEPKATCWEGVYQDPSEIKSLSPGHFPPLDTLHLSPLPQAP